MKRHFTRHTLLGALLLASSSLMAQDTPVAIRGAKLIPVTGPEIENGVLVVHRGKITAVGGPSTAIPRNATIIDGRGKVVMPGLVDSHSHVGGGDGGDGSAAQHPDVRIVDAINPRSDTFNKARAGGITTVNVMPGSGHLLSGQTAYLKLRANPRRIEDLLVNRSLDGIYGGIKMANGTNSLRAGGGTFPATRGRSALMQRNLFIKAQEYQRKMKEAGDDESKRPARDLQMETMVEVLEGKRMVHYHTHTHYDILTVLRLKEEFGFRVVLHHVSDAWAVADEIAAAGVASSIIHIDAPGGKLETMNITPENGVALERAGADFGYHTDDGITDSRVFLRSAAFGMRSGVSRAKAIESMTMAGARMLDLQDRIGSLDVGKDADFIILNGDPFSVYTRIEQTWVEGDKVFDFSDPAQRGFATGGVDVFRETHVHVACEH